MLIHVCKGGSPYMFCLGASSKSRHTCSATLQGDLPYVLCSGASSPAMALVDAPANPTLPPQDGSPFASSGASSPALSTLTLSRHPAGRLAVRVVRRVQPGGIVPGGRGGP